MDNNMVYSLKNVKKSCLGKFITLEEEVKKLLDDKDYLSMKNYIQHGTTSCILHSIAVTHYSVMLAHRMHIKINYNYLIMGALFHDYFLYDWHKKEKWHKWHGFNHPKFALSNAQKKLELSDIEKDIIKCHMFPLTLSSVPKYKESVIVCLVDKACAIYEMFARKNPYIKVRELYKI